MSWYLFLLMVQLVGVTGLCFASDRLAVFRAVMGVIGTGALVLKTLQPEFREAADSSDLYFVVNIIFGLLMVFLTVRAFYEIPRSKEG